MNEFFLNPAMQLEPGGPWWQVFTCHFTHWTYEQLAWDAIAFLALGAACARRHRAAFCATLLASAVLVPLAVLVFAPEVIAYRGLSGLDSGLFVLLLWTAAAKPPLSKAAATLPQSKIVVAVCGIAFIAKISYEMLTNHTVFAGSVAPVPVAHIAGAVAALLVLVLERAHRGGFRMSRHLALAVVTLAAASLLQAQTPFRAGVAMQNITPCPPNFPQPCPSSYIPVSQNVMTTGGAAATATGVIPDYDNSPSDLTARALLIEDASGNRALFVTADLLGFSAEFVKDVRARISRAIAGLTPASILINATHTHNAPAVKHLVGVQCTVLATEAMPLPQYVEAVKGRIVTAATQAAAAMQNATLHFSAGTTNVGGYRRDDQFLPFMSPYPQPLHVLQAKNGNSVIATVFAAGIHSTTGYGGAYLTADFPSDARKTLEAASPGSVALFVQGFAGDIGPMGGKSDVGQTLAAHVSATLASAVTLQGELAASSSLVRLPINANTSTWSITTSQPTLQSWMHDGMPELPVELQMIRIGGDPSKSTSWTLLASAHEVVSEYASKVRAKLPERTNLTLAGYSNMVESYVPTERMIQWDRSHCGYSPTGYEGCGSFHVYYRGLPNWTDNAYLDPIAALSWELNDTLIDDFAATIRDSKKWNNHILGRIGCVQPHDPAVALSQGSGELAITPLNAVAGYHYNGYVSARLYDFRGRQATVEIRNAPTGVAAEMLMSVGPSGTNLYRFDVQGTSGGVFLYAHYWTAAGNPRYFTVGNYDPVSQRYLRIRHDAATDQMRWETSPDNATWTQVFWWPREFDMSAVRAELMAGSWQASSNPGVARFGPFSLK